MSTLTLKLDSQNHWLADGSQTVWNFEFSGGYISKSHIRAYRETPSVTPGGDPTRTELVVDPLTDFVGDYQLLIQPAVPASDTLVIYRATPRDLPLVDFQDGGGITELNLDTATRQAVFLAQESADFLGVTTTADLVDLATTALTAAGQAAASAVTATTQAGLASGSANSASLSAGSASGFASAASTSAANAAAAATVAATTVGNALVNAHKAELANTASPSLGDNLMGVKVTSTGSLARTQHDRNEDRRSLLDFCDKLKAGGTLDASAAMTLALTAAMENGTGVLAGSGYMDIVVPVRTEGGLFRIDSQVVIPGEALVRFVGEGGPYFQSGFLQGFAGDMFTCTSGNFVTQFHNIRFQGQKSTYVGNYAALRTTQDAVHAGFTNCMFRDWGGVALELANCFDVTLDRSIFAYNKGGGFRNTGGASNRWGQICTQVNNGFGLYLAGGGNSGGPFFLEGDLIDNNPAGLNLSNRALRITGTDNVYLGGTVLTSALNDKTPVEFAASAERSWWVGVAASSKGTAASWVTFGAGANNCRIGGGLQLALTGNATAIATCLGDISGPYYALSNGEVLFSKGGASSAAGKGQHVGFDSVNNRGYIRSADPGTANYPMDLAASFITLRGQFATDSTVTAATLGSVVRKIAVYNEAGGLLGQIPVYNTIT